MFSVRGKIIINPVLELAKDIVWGFIHRLVRRKVSLSAGTKQKSEADEAGKVGECTNTNNYVSGLFATMVLV